MTNCSSNSTLTNLQLGTKRRKFISGFLSLQLRQFTSGLRTDCHAIHVYALDLLQGERRLRWAALHELRIWSLEPATMFLCSYAAGDGCFTKMPCTTFRVCECYVNWLLGKTRQKWKYRFRISAAVKRGQCCLYTQREIWCGTVVPAAEDKKDKAVLRFYKIKSLVLFQLVREMWQNI